MKTPDTERALVEEAKLGYLLRAEEKGGFFEAVGFTEDRAEVLKEALLVHARQSDISGTIETAFGVKYVVEGSLESPDGRNPEVRSVWIKEFGSDRLRFVTAYPGERRQT